MNDDEIRAAVERLVARFEAFAPPDLNRLQEFYTGDAWFKDPFNEVSGLTAVRGVYAHMFETLEAPRFVITDRIAQDAQCFLAWEFQFRFKRFRPKTSFTVRGSSHLKLAADGRIRWHRDYGDTAEEMYEKLPAIGVLMRWLKAQAQSG